MASIVTLTNVDINTIYAVILLNMNAAIIQRVPQPLSLA